MTSPTVDDIIARVRRAVRSVVDLEPNLLLQLARELGVALRPLPDGQLHYRGPEPAVAFLLPALKAHKVALLRGVCRRCRHNLATVHTGECEACASLGARSYTYPPGSIGERSYLAARHAQGIM